MIAECENCGAPLDVKDAQRFAKCGYCQATNRVKSMRTMAMETPAGWTQPKEWVPPPNRRAASSAPLTYKKPPAASAGINVGCIGVVLALAIGGGAAAYFGARVGGVSGVTFSFDARPLLGVFDPGVAPQLSTSRPGSVTGRLPASLLGGTACRGYLQRAPHLALRLSAAQFVTLATTSRTDLTMAIREPSGAVRCDDDSGEGQNPRITGGFAPGTYLVWIGTYSQGNSSDFTLSVATEQLGGTPLANGLVPAAPPALGAIDLDATPSTGVLAGTAASGRISASTLDSECRGYIRPQPHLTFRTREPRALAITTTGSTADLTLVVREPSGAFRCDDDSGESNNPLVRGAFAPGEYQVWVGTYSQNTSSPFALTVQTTATGAMPLPNGLIPGAAPAAGVVDLDAPGASAAATRAGTASGEISGSNLAPACQGYFEPAPALTVRTSVARRVELKASSRADAVALFVRGPSGETTCASATGRGGRAEIELDLAPGVHGVWVGGSSSGRRVAYSVSVEPVR